MKRFIASCLCVLMIFSLTACYENLFGHERYEKPDDYPKIFDLSEIRYNEEAFELFPETDDHLAVEAFYCEWELGIVGSAKVEILLTVNYSQAEFENELSRIKALGDGGIVYDTERFELPAYISMLGYMNTNYYALVDETNRTVHYVLLQLINTEDIDIPQEFIPDGYGELGHVQNGNFSIYHKNGER